MPVPGGKEIVVLHVDDEPKYAEMTARFLEQNDDLFTVETANSAAQGLELLGDRVDCVISDYDMPQMDGIEFLEAVREKYPDLPYILFTGKGSEEVASEAISAGVTDYLQKQPSTDQYTVLANRIQNAVEAARIQRDRERQLDAIEAAHEGISFLDNSGNFTYVNEIYADLYGYTPEELIGKHWDVVYPDDEAQMIREQVMPKVQSKGEWHGTTTGLRADGSTVVHEQNLVTNEHGELICTVRDISERRELEAELQDKANLLDQLFEQLPVSLYVKDREGRHLYMSEYDTDPQEAIGKTDLELYGDDEFVRETYEDDIRVIETGESIINKEEYNEANGEWMLTSKVPWYSDDGEIKGLIGVSRFITEKKEYEREIERKNEQLDQFASVVSHDLRNPLNVAKGQLDLAREICDCDPLDEVEWALDRMDQLIDELLTLAQQGEEVGTTGLIDLDVLAEECWRNVETADAALQLEIDHRIRGDRNRIAQLLENLMRNAIEHGGKNVEITIGEIADGFYVEDDGPGIPKSDRENVFEPGYSTAEAGTGFGLSIVKQVVDAHDWEVSVTEGTGGGARFELTGVEIVN